MSEGSKDASSALKGRPAAVKKPSSQMSSRNRLLALAVALCYGVFLVANRSRSMKPLPKRYAICSPRHRHQVLTLDGHNSRKECVVVEKGLVAFTGSLEQVRDAYGDLDTKGKVFQGKAAIKIISLSPGEFVMPGL